MWPWKQEKERERDFQRDREVERERFEDAMPLAFKVEKMVMNETWNACGLHKMKMAKKQILP